MDNIFSDDEEYESFRDQLYVAKTEDEDEKLVPMFGMYALFKTTNKEKPRQDLFLRGLEPPSNNLDPYKDGTFEHKKPVLKKSNLCENFSFFGMKQDKFRMELPVPSVQDRIAERNKLLENLRKMEEADKLDADCSQDQTKTYPGTPKRTPMQNLNSNTHKPKSAHRKRKRIVLSSDEESDVEAECSENAVYSSNRSPRKKRNFPITE